ncbi:hypothetical protein [Streptomyces sp. NPDC004726]
MARTGTTRRRALVVTGAVTAGALTGCAGDGRRSPDGDGGSADVLLRKRLAESSGSLRDQYDAVIAAHPALEGRLAPLRTSVADHVAALGGSVRVTRPASVPVPAGADVALKQLALTERQTADAYTAALADAQPELARLLASVAAAGAAHAYLLTGPEAVDGGAR